MNTRCCGQVSPDEIASDGIPRSRRASPDPQAARRGLPTPLRWLPALMLLAAVFNPLVHGQEQSPETVPGTPEVTPEVAPAPEPSSPLPSYTGTQVVSSLAPAPGAPPTAPQLQWGPFGVQPHLLYRFLYGNGVQATPGETVNTAINSLAPGVQFNLGDRWNLDYTAIKTLYSNRRFQDSLDHAAYLTGTTTYEDWGFQFSQNYASTTDPLVETGQQTSQRAFATAFRVTRGLGNRMRIEVGVNRNVLIVDGAPDSREYANQNWVHYQWIQGLDTAAGLVFGYVDVDPGPNMTYVRPMLRLGWRATPAISSDVQAGVERRSINRPGAGRLSNTVLSASLRYRPLDTTSLALQVSRDVAAAYFTDQVTQNTRWSINFDQRLLGELQLSASYAHQKVGYISTSGNLPGLRDDKYDSFSLRLSTVVLRRVTVTALYQDNRNSSDLAGFGFSSHQTGFEIGYRY